MVVLLNTLLRACCVALAALSLTWGIAAGEGLIASMAGAALGVILGQILGTSRVRLAVVLAVLSGLCLGTWAFGSWAMTYEDVPRAIGPATTLQVVYAARFGVLAFGAAAFSRAISIRVPTAAVVELVGLAASATAVFASHREGVIERPLWFSDWAWENGFAPSSLLYALGLGAVALLTVMHMLERRSGRPVSTVAAVVGFGILASWWFTYHPAQPPKPITDVPPVTSASGEPPRTPPGADAGEDARVNPENFLDGGVVPDAGDKDANDGGDSGNDAGDAGDGGDAGDASDGDGGQGADASDADGGSGDDAGDGGSSGQDGAIEAGLSDGGDEPSPTGDQPDGGSADAPESNNPNTSPQIVAVVVLDDDYTPPSGGFYLRQEAQSHFTGLRLAPTPRGDADLDVPLSFPTEPTPVIDPPTLKSRTKVRGMAGMLIEHNAPFALEGAVELMPMANPNARRFSRAYRFESRPSTLPFQQMFGKKFGNPAWSEELRKYYIEAPDDPRYQKLADQLLAKIPPQNKGDLFLRAALVKQYLDKTIAYSTKDRHEGVNDPTADMLFGNHVGYCVHLAHAAVYLWRTLGIPSRVASGYRVEEENRRGSTLLVRGADSHAWPEFYLEGYGWVIFDITPERVLDPPPKAADEELQQKLGEMMRQKPDPTPKPADKLIAVVKVTPKQVAKAVGGFVLAVLIILYSIKIWRFLRPFFTTAKTMPRVGYREAIDRLAEVGVYRDFGETREHFADRVARAAPSFATLTSLHMAAAFRDPKLDPSTREELSKDRWAEVRRAFHRELWQVAPLWRRVLGVLNPISFRNAR